MKISIATILLAFATHYNIQAQTQDTCIAQSQTSTQAFIPGYRDTITASDKRGVSIDLSLIVNGFKLQLKNPNYKILSFVLTFDSDCCISELISTGDQIVPRNDSIVQYKRIAEARIITIENIRVMKNNACYKIPSLIYYVSK